MHNIYGIPNAETIIDENDILILFGSSKDIKNSLKLIHKYTI